MEINTPVTVAIAIIALWIGFHINRRIGFLHTYNVPPAVSGGLLISALVATIEATTGHEIRFDLQLRDLLLIAFFSTIGLSARMPPSFRTSTRGKASPTWSSSTVC